MKKILVLLLVAIVTLVVAACGVGGGAEPPQVDTPEITTPPPETPPEPPPPPPEPPAPPEPPPTPPQEEAPSVAVGSVIPFGDFDWLVLDVQDDRMLIITEDIIAIRQYNPFENPWEGTLTTDWRTTWAESYMRQYLNNEFINNFSDEDKALIAETTVVTNDNPWHGTPGGDDTTDRIFLLSIEEVVRYFGDSGQLQDALQEQGRLEDQYNDARIALMGAGADVPDWYYRRAADAGSPWWWWLRSPGNRHFAAMNVFSDGTLIIGGFNVCGSFGSCLTPMGGGVRPAMWVYIN